MNDNKTTESAGIEDAHEVMEEIKRKAKLQKDTANPTANCHIRMRLRMGQPSPVKAPTFLMHCAAKGRARFVHPLLVNRGFSVQFAGHLISHCRIKAVTAWGRSIGER